MGRAVDRLLADFDQGGSWKPKSGRNRIRLIGGYTKKDEAKATELGAKLWVPHGILVYKQHFGLPSLDGEREKQSYRCLTDLGETCPLCAALDEFKSNPNDQALWKEHGVRPRACADLVVYSRDEDGEEEPTEERWYFGKTELEQLGNLIEDCPTLSDLDEGQDMILTVSATNKTFKGKPVMDKHLSISGGRPYEIELDPKPNILDALDGAVLLSQKQMQKLVDRLWRGGKRDVTE